MLYFCSVPRHGVDKDEAGVRLLVVQAVVRQQLPPDDCQRRARHSPLVEVAKRVDHIAIAEERLGGGPPILPHRFKYLKIQRGLLVIHLGFSHCTQADGLRDVVIAWPGDTPR